MTTSTRELNTTSTATSTMTHRPGRPVAQRVLGRLSQWRGSPAWPLIALFVGFPLWWVLGIAALLPIAVAVALLLQLGGTRRVFLPPGFAAWALFLVWVSLGVFVLDVDAPEAVPGGGGFNRLSVFAYRLGWYLACTVVLVWVINSDPKRVTWRLVTSLLGGMFVITAAGGLLGVLTPSLSFPSLLELLLPRGFARNAFVQSVVHPSIADIQLVLKRPEPRPTAPFAFSNTWGANLAMFLPFFVVSWVLEGRRWQRFLAAPIFGIALIPIVYSLNRGLWVCLAITVALVAVWVLGLSPTARVLGVLGVAAAAVTFVASPLGSLIAERLANQHSNDRRAQLLSQTVESTFMGSPIIGFGTTRDVQGSFASIAGAATPQCPACGVPPLGTQGHLWLVIFSQGIVGVGLFLALFASVLLMVWRCRTRSAAVATLLIVFFAVQVYVYDTLGMPLFTLMIGMGLAIRDHRTNAASGAAALPVWSSFRHRLNRARKDLATGVVLGAAFGIGLALQTPTAHAARVSILLDASPLSLADATLTTNRSSLAITVDTEAALVFAAASSIDAADPLRVRADQIQVTATPSTRALHIRVRDADPEAAAAKVQRLSQGYLAMRRDYLLNRRDVVINALRQQIRDFDTSAGGLPTSSDAGETRELFRKRVERIIGELLITPTNAGDVILTEPTVPVRSQPELPIVSGAAAGLGLAYVWALFGSARRNRRPLGSPHD